MHSRTPAHADRTRSAWYGQPVVWLGALLFTASLAGCVLMIVLGARHADVPLPTAGGEIVKMPLARPAPPPKPAQATP